MNNTNLSFAEANSVWYDIIGSFVVIIGAISLTCNISILFIFKKIFRRKKLQIMNLTLISLAISDIGICLHFPVIFYSCVKRGWYLSYEICKLGAFFDSLFSYSQIFVLTSISVTRMRATKNPNLYKPTLKESILVICLVWILSAIMASLPILGFGEFMVEGIGVSCTFNYIDQKNIPFVITIVFLGFAVPICVIIYSQTTTIRAVRSKNLNKKNQNLSNAVIQRNKKRELTIIKVTVRIVICFCISWTPYVFVALVSISGHKLSEYLGSLAGLFAKLSTTLNAMIYILSHQQFKKFFSSLQSNVKSNFNQN